MTRGCALVVLALVVLAALLAYGMVMHGVFGGLFCLLLNGGRPC